MQNPTPVITSGRSPSEWRATNAPHSSMPGSSPSSANASMIVRGRVQIEPKFVSGVTVATSRPAAAVAASRSSQPAVTTVSALRITTSPAVAAQARGSRCATKPQVLVVAEDP